MTTKQQVTEIFLKENRNITLNTDDDFQAHFKDVGIDSLDLMMAMLKIGETFGIEVTENIFDEIENVASLISFIDEQTA